MNLQQMVALGIRVFAVYVAIHSVKFLVSIPSEIADTNLASDVYISYGFGAVILLIAVLLWFFPMTLAHRIIPSTLDQSRVNLQAFDLVRAGASLIGLWLFANAMPAIIWFLFTGVYSARDNQSFIGVLSPSEKIALAWRAAQVALSFLFIFKSHYFASIAMRNIQKSEVDS